MFFAPHPPSLARGDWPKAWLSGDCFKAADARGQEIYHTNVMMSLADTFAVICLEAIPDETERELVVKTLTQTHKEIVPISRAQMNAFAGNMLTVQGHSGEKLLVLSQQAYESLGEDQVMRLSAHARLLPIPLYTIERSGGGSARCMMAEIFLPALAH
ncbi:MAG: hypothetical protein HC913_16495 [Microscillaceae bacterium]|nr:hypothetical protein [Microscillaceae bacterium]